MPVLIAVIVGFVFSRIVLVLGIGVVTFVGLDAAFDFAISAVESEFMTLAPASFALLGFCGLGKALAIIFSCISTRISWDVASGAASKLTFGAVGD
jgi:hypothetical protein